MEVKNVFMENADAFRLGAFFKLVRKAITKKKKKSHDSSLGKNSFVYLTFDPKLYKICEFRIFNLAYSRKP